MDLARNRGEETIHPPRGVVLDRSHDFLSSLPMVDSTSGHEFQSLVRDWASMVMGEALSQRWCPLNQINVGWRMQAGN